MSVQTVLLDFSIDPCRITDEFSRKNVMKVIIDCLANHFKNITFVYDILTADGYLSVYSDKNIVFFNIRLFNHGIITINIEYYKAETEVQMLTFDVSIWDKHF